MHGHRHRCGRPAAKPRLAGREQLRCRAHLCLPRKGAPGKGITAGYARHGLRGGARRESVPSVWEGPSAVDHRTAEIFEWAERLSLQPTAYVGVG
jgi:hypothetical protein